MSDPNSSMHEEEDYG
ncbi:TPA: protein NinF [Escherichia coli]